jgi:hypothetical protein
VTASTASRWQGRRVLYLVYASVVSIAAAMGFIIGVINPDGLNPVLFGVIDLPATPVGMVIFGVVYVSIGLGILMLAVEFVAERFDDADVN